MKKIFIIILLFVCKIAVSQTYDPTKGTVTNKPLAQAQQWPTDARSFYYDPTNFLWRPYQSTTEVKTFLNLSKYRAGNYTIVIDSGGTLNGNGTYTGGVNTFWQFRNGTADSNLVEMNLFGGGGGGGSGITNITASNGLGLTWTITNPTTTPNLLLALVYGGDVTGTTNNLSVQKFNGLPPAYYLNYNNLTNQPTIPPATVLIAGPHIGISGGPSTYTISAAGLPTTAGYGIALTSGGSIVSIDSLNYRKVDTLIGVNDSTLNYTLNGRVYSITLRGGAHGSGPGSGSVTNVSGVNANGVSWSIANPTSTPALTISLGAITPSSVDGLTLNSLTTGFSISGGTTSKLLTVPLDATVSGTNTGDVTLAGLTYATIAGQIITLGQVPLSSSVSGNLPAANFGALTGDVTTSLGSYATTIANNAVTYAKFQQVPANRLVGNLTGSLANASSVVLGAGLSASGDTLYASGTGLTTVTSGGGSPIFGTSVATSGGTAAITYTISNACAGCVLGNFTGAPASPTYGSPTVQTANLNLFTSSLQGLVPASGGGATNFLRADGSWAVAGTGNPNSNFGTGYRWAIPNTNNIKTAFAGVFIKIDSTSNTNGLTISVDTAAFLKDSIFVAYTPTGTNGATYISTNGTNTILAKKLIAGANLSIDSVTTAGALIFSATAGGTVSSVATAGTVNGITLTGGPITSSGTITLGGTLSGITNSNLSGSAGITSANLANTAVTAGSYTNTNITVNAQGQITLASNGAAAFITSLTTTGTSGAATVTTGVLNIPQYQGALTLTTTGTSGASTLIGNTLNIPQYSGGGGTPSLTTNLIGIGVAGVLGSNSAFQVTTGNAKNSMSVGGAVPTLIPNDSNHIFYTVSDSARMQTMAFVTYGNYLGLVPNNDIHGYAASGRQSAPLATIAGQTGFSFGTRFWDTAWESSSGGFHGYTPSLHSVTNHEAAWEFQTTANGSTARFSTWYLAGTGYMTLAKLASATPITQPTLYRTNGVLNIDLVSHSETNLGLLVQIPSNGSTSIIMGDGTSNEGRINRYGSTIAGNFSGTSVPLANNSAFTSGPTFNLPVVIAGDSIRFIIGQTSTNFGASLSASGFLVGTMANLTATPLAGFDVMNNFIAAGTDDGANTRSSNTAKTLMVKMPTYANTNVFIPFGGISNSTGHSARVGGGNANGYASNEIDFYTATTATTTTGTNVANFNLNGQLNLTPPTISSSNPNSGAPFTVTATGPTVMNATTFLGADWELTTAGTSAQTEIGIRLSQLAGYTGSSAAVGFESVSSVASTGSSLNWTLQSTVPTGNTAGYGLSLGTTAGMNIGWMAEANNANVNVAFFTKSAKTNNSGSNIASLHQAFNNGTGTITEVAGWFVLGNTSAPTLTGVKSAIVVDNGPETVDIAEFKANGTTVASFGSTGILTLNKVLTSTGTPTVLMHQTDSTVQQITVSALGALIGIPTLQQVLTSGSTLTGANTISQGNNLLTFSSGGQVLSGAITGAAGNASSQLSLSAATLTDNSSSGTVTQKAAMNIFTSTFAASSATTYTNAASLYINGTPAAGTNVTITNAWTLQVGGGNSLFQGSVYASHSIDNSAAPTIAAGTGAGTSPTISINGTDQSGDITVTTGTAPTLSATVATITFTGGFTFPNGTTPLLYPGNSNTAILSGVSMVFTTGSTGSWTITAGTTALTSATTYIWHYDVRGR